MILKNCSIITQNASREIIPQGFLVIKKDRIVRLGSRLPEKISPREKIFDLGGRTIMPGLVNAHCHLGDSIYKRTVGRLRSPADFLKVIGSLDSKISQAELENRKHKASLKALTEFLRNGVTTLSGGRGLKEAVSCGVRFLGGAMLKGKEDVVAEVDRIKKECRSSNFLFPGIFLHSLLEIPPQELYSFKKIAKPFGFIPMLHLAEFPEEKDLIFEKYGKGRIDLLQEIGLLSKNIRTVVVHGNFLEEKEVKQLSKYKVGVVLCPVSSRSFGFKTIDPVLLEKYGIKKAVATDGPLTNPKLNLFQDVQLLSPKEGDWQKLLDYVTIEAAQVLGIEEKVGSLEPGKFADILVLRGNPTIKDILIGGERNIDFIIIGGKYEKPNLPENN